MPSNKPKLQGYVDQSLFDKFQDERLRWNISQSEALEKILSERYYVIVPSEKPTEFLADRISKIEQTLLEYAARIRILENCSNPPSESRSDTLDSNPPSNLDGDTYISNPPSESRSDTLDSNPPSNLDGDTYISNLSSESLSDTLDSNPPSESLSDTYISNPPSESLSDTLDSNPPSNLDGDTLDDNPPSDDSYIVGLLKPGIDGLEVAGYWLNFKAGFVTLEQAKIYNSESNAKRAITSISKKIELAEGERISYKLLSKVQHDEKTAHTLSKL